MVLSIKILKYANIKLDENISCLRKKWGEKVAEELIKKFNSFLITISLSPEIGKNIKKA